MKGLEDQGEVKELGRTPPAVLLSPDPPGFLLALPWAPWNSLKGSTFKEKMVSSVSVIKNNYRLLIVSVLPAHPMAMVSGVALV